MTEASNPTAPIFVRPDDLSIVLFGLPGAGKSSLLGALAQAAQTQEHLLNGRLIDLSHGLEALRRRLYEGSELPTAEEIAPYPVDFESFLAENARANTPQHFSAVFIDCDGRAANDLLIRRQDIPEDSPGGTLAREVNDADTLVLVVDASALPAQVEAEFAEFERFLRQTESSRGQRTKVGGLPVFLVLTKCDLLAQPGDTVPDWMERIEQHKRDLDRRFCAFLLRGEQESGPLLFGRIQLHLWATAVKRPPPLFPPKMGGGEGGPAEACEPYGVAELFRQCLEQAAAFRDRRRRAGRRLAWTVGTSGGIVALMAALAVSFTLYNLDTPINALRERVQIALGSDSPSETERLHAPIRELRRRAEELRAICNDPLFESLSAHRQRVVRDRLDELEEYLQYFDRLVQSPSPRDVHSTKALLDIKEQLKTELALPKEAWQGTEAARLYLDRLEDAEALAIAVKQTTDWYRDSAAKAEQLRTFSIQRTERGAAGVNWDRWTNDVEILLRPERGAKTRGNDATVQRFDEVKTARLDWEEKKGRLQRLLDLCAALGLALPGAFPRGEWERGGGVLSIPRRFALSQARERRNVLEQHYPNYKSDFVFDEVPDAIRAIVDQAARNSYEHLLGPAQDVVMKRLEQGGSGAEETQPRWENVLRWLRDPKELEDWRVLADVLVRLHDPGGSHGPESADPVHGLAAFLERTSFTLSIQRITVEVPEGLERKPAADAPFSIFHPAPSGGKPALQLRPSGEGERDPQRRVWIYSYRLPEPQRFAYRPGDALWATLPLRDDWMFTWEECRSLMYQFERLTRPPRLHQTKEAAANGTLQEEVRLTIFPGDGVPRLPDLLPVVRLR